MTNSFFEISYVEDDKPFYQLSDLPVYRLNCSLFEYNDEDFDTGVESIDTKINQVSYQVPLSVNLLIDRLFFKVGETISQTLTPAVGDTPAIVISGEVAQVEDTGDSSQNLWISHIGVTGSGGEARDFTVGGTISGSDNNYQGTITAIRSDVTDTTGGAWVSDGAAENVALESFADNFLDFTESNPFGDPSETY
jgi:hypothetical protein